MKIRMLLTLRAQKFLHLQIEVKSNIEIAHIRMAIGQLYDYWYTLNGNSSPHLALLLPEKPTDHQFQFLNWLEIGVLWFEDDYLCTENEWLKSLQMRK